VELKMGMTLTLLSAGSWKIADTLLQILQLRLDELLRKTEQGNLFVNN
jgi:hypothetical protein